MRELPPTSALATAAGVAAAGWTAPGAGTTAAVRFGFRRAGGGTSA